MEMHANACNKSEFGRTFLKIVSLRLQFHAFIAKMVNNVCVSMQKTLEIAQLVQGRRKLLGLSQQELADFAGCSRLFVSEIERGKTTFQFDKFLSVLEVLGLKMKLIGKEQDAG